MKRPQNRFASLGWRRLGTEAPGPSGVVDAPRVRPPRRSVRIDGNTRTFWAGGEGSSGTTTLIEAEVLLHRDDGPSHVRNAVPRDEPRPLGNPAFSETLFVELMRTRQFVRAYAHISPECQRRWGSAEAFAAAQSGAALATVQGVTVGTIRYLDRWTDPDSACAHHNVAELAVEYTLGREGGAARLARTVHLVPFEGRWRSLCPPPAVDAAPARRTSPAPSSDRGSQPGWVVRGAR